jgi:hypothetical protein
MSRNTVQTERLSDGSKVYNVISLSDDGALILFACTSKGAAEDLKDVLDRHVIDVSIREVQS